jgi:m7GpppX diphosphatase
MLNPGILTNDYVLLAETPALHARAAGFIEQEVRRPSKQWIASIISGDQEKDQVILRTDEFVLLPDTERVNRYWRTTTAERGKSSPKGRMTLNWLAIVHDLRVRTLRDLRGEHLPMLRRMLEACMAEVEQTTGLPRDQVMAYVHYPPSVYQLHVHFSYPYGQFCHRDAYRVHSLEGIINNLEIDPEYYARATLLLAMHRQSPHCLALTGAERRPDKGRCCWESPLVPEKGRERCCWEPPHVPEKGRERGVG